MRRFALRAAAVAILAGCCLAVSAQAPSFRSRGYKGNVGIQTFELMPGILTSHGYMFNGHHYLGAGFNATVFPDNDFEMAISPFIEYQAYFLKRNSTPVAGIKLEHLTYLESGSIHHYIGLSPNFGWSWGIGSRRQFGIMPYIGCALFFDYAEGFDLSILNPYLGVAFEF